MPALLSVTNPLFGINKINPIGSAKKVQMATKPCKLHDLQGFLIASYINSRKVLQNQF